jgi:hypothetical protein
VPTVVGGGVLVDLDYHDVVVAGVLLEPIGVDQYFLPTHDIS